MKIDQAGAISGTQYSSFAFELVHKKWNSSVEPSFWLDGKLHPSEMLHDDPILASYLMLMSNMHSTLLLGGRKVFEADFYGSDNDVIISGDCSTPLPSAALYISYGVWTDTFGCSPEHEGRIDLTETYNTWRQFLSSYDGLLIDPEALGAMVLAHELLEMPIFGTALSKALNGCFKPNNIGEDLEAAMRSSVRSNK